MSRNSTNFNYRSLIRDFGEKPYIIYNTTKQGDYYYINAIDLDGNILQKIRIPFQAQPPSGHSLARSGDNIYSSYEPDASFNDLYYNAYNIFTGVQTAQKNIAPDTSNHSVFSIVIDSSGNIYTTGERNLFSGVNVTTRKFNSSGTQQWQLDFGTLSLDLAVDGSGNVIVVGQDAGTYTTRKYNSSGTLQWSVDQNTLVLCCTTDSSGNVYTGGSNGSIRKYNSAGTQQWSISHGVQVRDIAVDSSGNVYICGSRTSSITTRKYNSSGTLQWSVDQGQTANSLYLGASSLYICSQNYIKIYDLSGNLEKTINLSETSFYAMTVIE